MRLWIAFAAGLSLAQTPDIAPVTPPLDPSVRDPAAEALHDAYEEAARNAEGAKPPEGYVVQEPNDLRTTYTFTPVLPDGAPPASLRDLTKSEAAQVYQPVPTPWENRAQEEQATGGGGAETSESQQGAPTPGAQTGAAASGAAAPATGAQAGSPPGTTPQAATGGAGTAGAPGATVQEPTGATGQQGQGATGGAGTTGAASTPEQNFSGAAQQNATTGAAQQSATGGAGNTGTATQQPATEGNYIGGRSVVSENNPTRDTTIGGRSVVTGPDTSGGTTPQQPARPPTPDKQLEQLQTHVQQLESELKQRDAQLQKKDQQLAQNSTDIEQHIDQTGGRALETEQSRQERLSQIDVAGQWMLAADQALARGEFAVENAINSADRAFENVRLSADSDGQNMVVAHAERARAFLRVAMDAVINRDNYAARVALADAGLELRGARNSSLPRDSTGNVMLNP